MAKQIEASPVDLNTLRLPELQARFAEVVGEMSRSPNRKFLIRRIEETLAAKPAQVEEAPMVADEATAEAPAAQPEPAPVEPQPEGACPENGDECVGCALCDPADAEVLADAEATVSAPATVAGPKQRGRFAGMSVEQLQAEYLRVVGRPTGSTEVAYIQWKIREAEKGRITVGPVQTRKTGGESADMKILPLRLETETVKRMDAAWRERGIKTRMEFFRRALGHYLTHLGAADVAALFAAAE
jgi:hypothetical protein